MIYLRFMRYDSPEVIGYGSEIYEIRFTWDLWDMIHLRFLDMIHLRFMRYDLPEIFGYDSLEIYEIWFTWDFWIWFTWDLSDMIYLRFMRYDLPEIYEIRFIWYFWIWFTWDLWVMIYLRFMRYDLPEIYEIWFTWNVWDMIHLRFFRYDSPEIYEIWFTWDLWLWDMIHLRYTEVLHWFWKKSPTWWPPPPLRLATSVYDSFHSLCSFIGTFFALLKMSRVSLIEFLFISLILRSIIITRWKKNNPERGKNGVQRKKTNAGKKHKKDKVEQSKRRKLDKNYDVIIRSKRADDISFIRLISLTVSWVCVHFVCLLCNYKILFHCERPS